MDLTMTNVIQFKPVKGTSRKFADIRQMERNKLWVRADLERNRSWWQRFRSNIARLFGVHAMPRRDVAPSSDTHSVGGAA